MCVLACVDRINVRKCNTSVDLSRVIEVSITWPNKPRPEEVGIMCTKRFVCEVVCGQLSICSCIALPAKELRELNMLCTKLCSSKTSPSSPAASDIGWWETNIWER